MRTRREAYAGFFPAEYLAAMSVEQYTSAWQERLSGGAPEMQTFVAENTRGDIAGFTRFGHHNGLQHSEGEVEFLYVAPEYWRQGAGTMLMREAVATMTRAGLESAVLWVYRDNDPRERSMNVAAGAMTGRSRTVISPAR